MILKKKKNYFPPWNSIDYKKKLNKKKNNDKIAELLCESIALKVFIFPICLEWMEYLSLLTARKKKANAAIQTKKKSP